MADLRWDADTVRLAALLRDDMKRKLIAMNAIDITATWLSEISGFEHEGQIYRDDRRLGILKGTAGGGIVPVGCRRFPFSYRIDEQQSLPGAVYFGPGNIRSRLIECFEELATECGTLLPPEVNRMLDRELGFSEDESDKERRLLIAPSPSQRWIAYLFWKTHPHAQPVFCTPNRQHGEWMAVLKNDTNPWELSLKLLNEMIATERRAKPRTNERRRPSRKGHKGRPRYSKNETSMSIEKEDAIYDAWVEFPGTRRIEAFQKSEYPQIPLEQVRKAIRYAGERERKGDKRSRR